MSSPSQPSPQPIEQVVQEHLDRLGVPYRIIDIDPTYADTASFCERYGYPPERSVNCILVTSKTGAKQYAACLVQATRRLDVNRVVRRLMGVRRASFALTEETGTHTGMRAGGVTPFGLSPDIPVYVDAPVMALSEIVVGGGGRATKVALAPQALERLPNATVVEGLSLTPER
ncbi:MAG: YbaK/EbsC family protein [Egibacteraceae bacterium]